MIHDSGPWRDQLARTASDLVRLAAQRRFTDRRSVLVERSLIFAAFAMRKLDDAQKLSSAWAQSEVDSIRYPLLSRPPDLLNWHHIARHYDLERGSPDQCKARDFCNLVVHSFILMEAYSDDRTLDGFFINSDTSKKRAVWFFGVREVVALITRTADDHPASVHAVRDPKTGEWRSWRGHGEPPKEWQEGIKGG